MESEFIYQYSPHVFAFCSALLGENEWVGITISNSPDSDEHAQVYSYHLCTEGGEIEEILV